ncbi:MAG TPA: hypothetical protein VHN98_01675 [Acidimicrobiales bacterium]|nr:hypothetical protein [Acidimicrobiales bacterium]
MAMAAPRPAEGLREAYARIPIGVVTALFVGIVVLSAGTLAVAWRLVNAVTVPTSIPVLLQTDFSSGPWPFPDDDLAGSTVAAGNGVYVLTAGDATATPVLRFAPFLGKPSARSVEVAVTVSSTPVTTGVVAIGGIACTDAAGSNGYAFLGSTSGEYSLVAIVDGRLTTLASATGDSIGDGQRLDLVCTDDHAAGGVAGESLVTAAAPAAVARALPLRDGFTAAGLVLVGQEPGARAAFDDVVALVL